LVSSDSACAVASWELHQQHVGGQVRFDSGQCCPSNYDVICRWAVDDEKLVIGHHFSWATPMAIGRLTLPTGWNRSPKKLSKGVICRLIWLSAIPMPLKASAKITFTELPVSISTRPTS
ncbi:unnamed protein product, partial [Prunus brigantina]